jgi:hypothetical protein
MKYTEIWIHTIKKTVFFNVQVLFPEIIHNSIVHEFRDLENQAYVLMRRRILNMFVVLSLWHRNQFAFDSLKPSSNAHTFSEFPDISEKNIDDIYKHLLIACGCGSFIDAISYVKSMYLMISLLMTLGF